MPEDRDRPPRRKRASEPDDDDLVGPRRPARARPRARPVDDVEEEDDLVGPRRMDSAPGRARRPRPRPLLDDEDEIEIEAPRRLPAPRLRRRSTRGGGAERDRETLKSVIRDIPNFLKLLAGLAVDPRVSRLDKAIVVAATAYLLSPIDLLPDLGVLGQIEDVALLALAVSRLVNNAGMDVLLDHWNGELSSLEAALAALERAGSLLPERLRTILGGSRR